MCSIMVLQQITVRCEIKHNTPSLLLSMEPCYTSVTVLLVLSLLAVCCSGESYRVQLNCLRVCMLMIGQCRFEYVTQPSSSTVNGCNPYQGNTIQISLECIVRMLTGINDLIEIRWFRQNTTGGVKDLGRRFVVKVRELWKSQCHITGVFNQYNPSLIGKYWCQVINTTADPDQPLMRSNVFTLLPPDNYTGSTCSGAAILQHVDNVTCADLSVTSEQNTLLDTSVVNQATHLG